MEQDCPESEGMSVRGNTISQRIPPEESAGGTDLQENTN